MSKFMQIDDREFKAALLRFYASQKKTWPEVIKSQARLISVNLAYQTAPFGDAKSARDNAQKAIGVEIGRVYKAVSTIAKDIKDAGKTFAELPRIKNTDQASAAFVRLVRNGNYDRAQQLLNSLMIDPYGSTMVGQMDDGKEHQLVRHGSRKKVSKNQFPRLGVDFFKAVPAYVKKIQQRVGTAKAGWAACAKALGGFRGIPAWVHKHTSERLLGGSQDFTSQKNPHVIITNSVPWIDKCLSQGQIQKAIDIQRQKMIAAVGYAMQRDAKAMGF